MAANAAFRIDPSQTSAFKALAESAAGGLEDAGYVEPLKAVVIGGGTGAPVSIRSLLSLGVETSAVVAMADDGGSTGILREAANITPPGDVRKCIAAFAKNPDDPLVRAFKYRIEIANDHALGNLMLACLEDACGSFPEAITICERMLGAQGHVYPSTLDHVTLAATTKDGRFLDGQAVACHSTTALQAVSLRSDSGAIEPYPAAVKAILEADLIVLGPGSLFTSIIANLLVPGILEAIEASNAATLFVCSVADTQGETWGLSAKEHIEALFDHGMEGLIDYALVHSKVPLRAESPATSSFLAVSGEDGVHTSTADLEDRELAHDVRPVPVSYADVMAVQAKGTIVISRDLTDERHPTWHSPAALRSSILQVVKLAQARQDKGESCPSPLM